MTFRSCILSLSLLLFLACGTEAESSRYPQDQDEQAREQVEVPAPVASEEEGEEPPAPPIVKANPVPKTTPKSEIPAAFRNEMLELVNEIRAEGCTCGDRVMPPAPPLKWNGKLAQAALGHAKDMDKNNFIGHKGSDGSKISDRVSRAKYAWRAVGENVSWNAPTVAGAVQGWKDSPGHCQNMMNKSFKEIGAAWEGAYMVQVFGRQ